MGFGDSLQQASALVVGASQGIGLGFVHHLLADSRFDQVYATYRDFNQAGELLALAQTTAKLRLLELDVTDEGTVAAAIANLQTQTPRLHLAIYSAGLLHDHHLQPEKSLLQVQPENLLRSFQVNAVGGVLLAKYLLPLFKHNYPSVYGVISAKVGSIGDNRLGGWYGYRASKAALNMLIKTAAVEYGRKSPHTILALLHPGTTDTRLSQPFQQGVPRDKLFPVPRTVAQLITVINGLKPEDSGVFFNWDGQPLPW
jgi:NAD(P)-dependent dehydrogenase (short-subunit alcohol dehydrogenase family)